MNCICLVPTTAATVTAMCLYLPPAVAGAVHMRVVCVFQDVVAQSSGDEGERMPAVGVASSMPKLTPANVRVAPWVVGALRFCTVSVRTGASNVYTLTRVPTTAEIVTTALLPEPPNVGACTQVTEVVAVYATDMHSVWPMRIVGEGFWYPKARPVTVTLWVWAGGPLYETR